MTDEVGVLRVMELFAGVGGFRLGLAGLPFEVVYSNQYEPSTRRQHASEVYRARWGETGHSNDDIFKVLADDAKFAEVRSASPDVLVAGFPCQDYSVAKPAGQADGLEGKKGVLWWAIHETLRKRLEDGAPIKYLILENVDRLLKSPTGCRGRDFAVILSSLHQLGYAVEWRVINAAEWGFPQRRRRVFIVGCHKSARLHATLKCKGAADWLLRDGVFAHAFPAVSAPGSVPQALAISTNVLEMQARYRACPKGKSLFANAGICVGGHVWSLELRPQCIDDYTAFTGKSVASTLGDVVKMTTPTVPAIYYLPDSALAAWRRVKGGKQIQRIAANGHVYTYSEGAVGFPDALERPSRTLITAEGGNAPSRFKHVITDADGRLRRLTPEEIEELMGFPRGFTAVAAMPDAKRVFLMGNAVVVGVVRRVAEALAVRHQVAEGELHKAA